jgi:hypothetical protein
MKNYAWAQNESKLQRAIGELGPDASEEAIKARYIEMAGFVLNDAGEHTEEEPEGVDAQELLVELKKSKPKKK